MSEIDLCEVAAEVETLRIRAIVEAVASLYDGTDAFSSGYSLACEEILHRINE